MHGLPKKQAVFGGFDSVEIRADELHAIFFKHAIFAESQRKI